MPLRFSRNRPSTLSPIQSKKHYVQLSQFTIASAARLNQLAVLAVDDPTVANTFEVRTGSSIKAIYIEFWLLSDDAANSAFQLNVEKSKDTETPMTFAESILLHGYHNKNKVFYSTQGLTPTVTGSPIPVIRSWIKIPKGFQRMALGDRITCNISGITNGLIGCGQFVYKEYQ